MGRGQRSILLRLAPPGARRIPSRTGGTPSFWDGGRRPFVRFGQSCFTWSFIGGNALSDTWKESESCFSPRPARRVRGPSSESGTGWTKRIASMPRSLVRILQRMQSLLESRLQLSRLGWWIVGKAPTRTSVS